MSETTGSGDTKRLRWLAIASLAFTVAVILGGAVVRATGSGAGCGESWPRCDGRLIPTSPGIETVIEFVHRVMSASLGVALLALGIGLSVRAARRTRRSMVPTVGAMTLAPMGRAWKSPAEHAFGWAVLFFFGEVIIGAVLVIFGWVDDDASFGRVVTVIIHLVNTFLLLGSLALCVFHLRRGDVPLNRSSPARTPALIGVVVLLMIGASGGLNALADTLYGAESLISGLQDDFDAASPLLVRLRTLHPLLAAGGGVGIFLLAQGAGFRSRGSSRLRQAVQSIIAFQFVVGVANLALLTPLEMQVFHLFVADALWLVWVWYCADALRATADAPEPSTVSA